MKSIKEPQGIPCGSFFGWRNCPFRDHDQWRMLCSKVHSRGKERHTKGGKDECHERAYQLSRARRPGGDIPRSLCQRVYRADVHPSGKLPGAGILSAAVTHGDPSEGTGSGSSGQSLSWGWQTASAPPVRKGPGLAPGLFPFGAGEKPVAKMGILWYTSSHKRAVSRESAWKRSC